MILTAMPMYDGFTHIDRLKNVWEVSEKTKHGTIIHAIWGSDKHQQRRVVRALYQDDKQVAFRYY